MKRAVGLSLLVCGLIGLNASSLTAGGVLKKVPGAIAEQLGVRWQKPADNVRVGESVPAIVMDSAKLERYGMKTQANDEVVFTRVEEKKIVVSDVKGEQKLAFLFDEEGTLKLVE